MPHLEGWANADSDLFKVKALPKPQLMMLLLVEEISYHWTRLMLLGPETCGYFKIQHWL